MILKRCDGHMQTLFSTVHQKVEKQRFLTKKYVWFLLNRIPTYSKVDFFLQMCPLLGTQKLNVLRETLGENFLQNLISGCRSVLTAISKKCSSKMGCNWVLLVIIYSNAKLIDFHRLTTFLSENFENSPENLPQYDQEINC